MTFPENNEVRQESDIIGSSSLAWKLEILAFVLFIVYGTTVAVSLFPPKLLDPAWQFEAIKILLDNAAIPLLGLGVMHLAAYLGPYRISLQRRRSELARLAILAALGFLLIIPLQFYSVWKAYTVTTATINKQQLNISTKAEAIRSAVKESTSPEDLKRRLQALQRPDFRINFDDLNISEVPLPQLKEQILIQLNQAEGRFNKAYRQPDQAAVEDVIRGSMTVIISAAAFSLGFAAVAQRKNSPVPFLLETPWLIASLASRRARPGQQSGGLPFRKAAAKREEEFFASLAPPEEEGPPSS